MKKKEYDWIIGLLISGVCEFVGLMLMAINEGSKTESNELLSLLPIAACAGVLPAMMRFKPFMKEKLRMRYFKLSIVISVTMLLFLVAEVFTTGKLQETLEQVLLLFGFGVLIALYIHDRRKFGK